VSIGEFWVEFYCLDILLESRPTLILVHIITAQVVGYSGVLYIPLRRCGATRDKNRKTKKQKAGEPAYA